MLILSILDIENNYVYKMHEFINKEIDISINTLYTCAYYLEEKDYIKAYSITVGKKRKRTVYKITLKGREHLYTLKENYQKTIKGVSLVLNKVKTT